MNCNQCKKELKNDDNIIVIQHNDNMDKATIVCSWECSFDYRLQQYLCHEYKLQEVSE